MPVPDTAPASGPAEVVNTAASEAPDALPAASRGFTVTEYVVDGASPVRVTAGPVEGMSAGPPVTTSPTPRPASLHAVHDSAAVVADTAPTVSPLGTVGAVVSTGGGTAAVVTVT